MYSYMYMYRYHVGQSKNEYFERLSAISHDQFLSNIWCPESKGKERKGGGGAVMKMAKNDHSWST